VCRRAAHSFRLRRDRIVIVLIANAPSYRCPWPIRRSGFHERSLLRADRHDPSRNTPQEMTARVFGARIALTNLSWLPIIFLAALS